MRQLMGTNNLKYLLLRHQLFISNHSENKHKALKFKIPQQTLASSQSDAINQQKNTKELQKNNKINDKQTTNTKPSPKDQLISTKNQKKSVKQNLNETQKDKQKKAGSQQNRKQKCRKRKIQIKIQTKQKQTKGKGINLRTKYKSTKFSILTQQSVKPLQQSTHKPQQSAKKPEFFSKKPQQSIKKPYISQSQQTQKKDSIVSKSQILKNYQQVEDTQANSKYPYCDELQQSSSIHIPWIPILCVLAGILFISFIIWLIITIRKRILTTKQYNQTPQNFIEKPTLSLNQSKNLKIHSVKPFDNYKQVDVLVQNKKQYGGNIYELKFMNLQAKNFSAAYWSKALKTDCYFEIQIETLNSQIQFGFINKKYLSLLNSGVQTKIGRVGVSLNSQGNLQLLGQIKYQYRWNLQYGDVIGIGITELDKTKRIWVTKNGVLLNPPTSDEIDKWLSKESLSQQHRDTYLSLNEEGKNKNLNKKQDLQLIKKKISLPANQDFEYYAVVGSLQIKPPAVKKSIKFAQKLIPQDNQENQVTVVRFNVGGKTFRLRDNNLKSGLLADSIQKNQFCNWLPCF